MNDETQARKGKTESSDAPYVLAGRMLVRERFRGIRKVVGRRLAHRDIVLRKSPADARQHLFEQACELYWNEMSWEELTDEEVVEGEELTELVFPALIALIDAYLPKNRNGEPDRDREHRDVVHDFLDWLAVRLVKLREAPRPKSDHERTSAARQEALTDDLIDIIAFRLCGLSTGEIETYQNR